MITQEQINLGGSKLEITRSLLESGLDKEIPVPRSIWKYSAQDLDPVLKEFEHMKKPVIVRGSHPNDYHGFIDIVPTVRDVYTKKGLEKAVKEIEDRILQEDIKIHCEDWNQPYSREVHILVQEKTSDIVGSMIRHPHDKKQLRIQYLDLKTCKEKGDPVSCCSLENSGFRHKSNLGISDDKIKELIEMYEKLESSGILDNEYSQQIEFGLNPLMFFQARPFKRFQPRADFSIYELIPKGLKFDQRINSTDCFGITPKEGIDLEFYFLDDCYFNPTYPPDLPLEKPYGLGLTTKPCETISPGCKLGNLKVFCSPCERNGYLYHFNYRFMKKAEITLISGIFYDSLSICREFEQSRVFADGLNGVIIPRKYF